MAFPRFTPSTAEELRLFNSLPAEYQESIQYIQTLIDSIPKLEAEAAAKRAIEMKKAKETGVACRPKLAKIKQQHDKTLDVLLSTLRHIGSNLLVRNKITEAISSIVDAILDFYETMKKTPEDALTLITKRDEITNLIIQSGTLYQQTLALEPPSTAAFRHELQQLYKEINALPSPNPNLDAYIIDKIKEQCLAVYTPLVGKVDVLEKDIQDEDKAVRFIIEEFTSNVNQAKQICAIFEPKQEEGKPQMPEPSAPSLEGENEGYNEEQPGAGVSSTDNSNSSTPKKLTPPSSSASSPVRSVLARPNTPPTAQPLPAAVVPADIKIQLAPQASSPSQAPQSLFNQPKRMTQEQYLEKLQQLENRFLELRELMADVLKTSSSDLQWTKKYDAFSEEDDRIVSEHFKCEKELREIYQYEYTPIYEKYPQFFPERHKAQEAKLKEKPATCGCSIM